MSVTADAPWPASCLWLGQIGTAPALPAGPLICPCPVLLHTVPGLSLNFPGPSQGVSPPRFPNVGAPAGLCLRRVHPCSVPQLPTPTPAVQSVRQDLSAPRSPRSCRRLSVSQASVPPTPAPPAPQGHLGLPVVKSRVIPSGSHCVLPSATSDTRGGPAAPSLPGLQPLLPFPSFAGVALLAAPFSGLCLSLSTRLSLLPFDLMPLTHALFDLIPNPVCVLLASRGCWSLLPSSVPWLLCFCQVTQQSRDPSVM